MSPRTLPDGETLLFNTGNPVSGEIAMQSTGSEEPTILLEGVSPTYVPTGHLVYGVGDVLFAVPFDLSALEVTGGAVPLVEGIATPFIQYAVSDSGSLVYLPGLSTDLRTLVLADRNGGLEPLNVPPKRYVSPRVSPDGQILAVQSLEDDGESHIWTYDLTGGTAIQQLTMEGNNQRPVWTPDGRRVTFASDRDGTMSIYWKRADGSGVADGLTRAEEGTEHRPESWSPDGRTLSFSVDGPEGLDIWTVSGQSGPPEGFAQAPGASEEFGSAFSPDGNWIAYNSGPGGQAEVYVEPFPATGEKRRISQELGVFPLWSPDGNELFYRPLAGGGIGQTLKRIAILTEPTFAFSSEERLPISNFLSFSYYRSYDITPDGDRFLMVFPVDDADSGAPPRLQINIVLNWFEELKARVPAP